MNHLFYGDNLDVLRDHVATASVGLVYLDAPFNSNADYDTILRTPSGKAVPAQEDAFKDTWQWDDAVSGVAVRKVERDADHQAAGLMLDAMVGPLGRDGQEAAWARPLTRVTRWVSCLNADRVGDAALPVPGRQALHARGEGGGD